MPDLAAGLVRLLDEDGIESTSRRRQVGHELVVFLFGGSVRAQVALAPAQLVVAEVSRDGVDPAAEVERLVDPVHHAEGLHERLLGDVLGQQRIPQLAADQPVDRRDVAPVELLERSDVSLAVSPDQLDVGWTLLAGWPRASFLA